MKQISLDALNGHMFEAMEMLKNNSDPEASDCEKIDINTAKAIAGLGKNIVEAYKVKAQVLSTMAHMGENGTKIALQTGIIDETQLKLGS